MARMNYKLPNNLQIIGISGHARSGKDSLCQMLYSTYTDTYSEAMAAPLKLACADMFGIPSADFNDPIRKEEINPYWKVSPRMIAQFIGTEFFRDQIWKLLPADQGNFLVRRMFGRLSTLQQHEEDGSYEEGDTVVIPDIRFQEEVDFINDNNGVHIHLSRGAATGEVGIPGHGSEALNFELEGERTYALTNNGTLEYLFGRVRVIVAARLNLTPYSISESL